MTAKVARYLSRAEQAVMQRALRRSATLVLRPDRKPEASAGDSNTPRSIEYIFDLIGKFGPVKR